MQENTFNKLLGPFEYHVVSIQSILIWENPLRSALAILAVNALFWSTVFCNLRFYFSISVLTLCAYATHLWVNKIWPEIRIPLTEDEDMEDWTPVHPQVLSVPEISRYLSRSWNRVIIWWDWLWDLRQTHPGEFCTLTVCFLGTLLVIGHYISGVLLAYSAVMGVMTVPGLMVQFLPNLFKVEEDVVASEFSTRALASEGDVVPCVVDDLKDTPSKESDNELDEFMPETSEETLKTLSLPLEQAQVNSPLLDNTSLMAEELELDLNDSINEDVPAALITGLQFSEHDQDSQDEMDFNFSKEPTPEVIAPSRPPPESIKFVAHHFNGDSSSEEEEELCKGLSMPDPIEDTQPAQTVSERTSNEPKLESSVGENLEESVLDAIRSTTEAHSEDNTVNDVDLTDFEVVSKSQICSK